MVILHFSDVHARDKDISEINDCLGDIIQVAHDNAPDLIVMAGDTFDSRMVRLDSQAAKLIFNSYQALADIAPMVVIVGTPSHDGLTVEVLEHISATYDIYVAEKPEQILLDERFTVAPAIGNPRAVISLLPAPTKQYWEQSGQVNQDIDESDTAIANALGVMMAGFGATAAEYDVPHILVGHFTVGGAQLSPTQTMVGRDIEVSRGQIGYAQADLICLGHIHYPQKIGDNIFYSGSISRLSFGELEDKGCYIHTLENGTLHSDFHRTPSQKRLILSPDMTNGCKSIKEFLLDQNAADLAGAHVRLDIRVFQDEAGDLDEGLIRAILPDVDIHIQRVPRETVRSAQILKVDRLRDKLAAMAELRKEEVPAEILAKADHLETMQADELLKMVSNG